MKPVHFIGTSHSNLSSFPAKVRREVGFSVYLAQCGDKAINTLPLTGFRSAGVLEVVADHKGNTYRVVYTVGFRHAIYVLHAFQKKSKKGSRTPKHEMDIVLQRLKVAEQHHEKNYTSKQREKSKGY